MAVSIEGKKQKALICKEATLSKIRIEEHMKIVNTVMDGAKQEINQLVLIKKEEAKEVCHAMNKLKLDIKAERTTVECEMMKSQSAHKEMIKESNEAVTVLKELLQQFHALKDEMLKTYGANVGEGPPFKKMATQGDDGVFSAVAVGS